MASIFYSAELADKIAKLKLSKPQPDDIDNISERSLSSSEPEEQQEEDWAWYQNKAGNQAKQVDSTSSSWVRRSKYTPPVHDERAPQKLMPTILLAVGATCSESIEDSAILKKVPIASSPPRKAGLVSTLLSTSTTAEDQSDDIPFKATGLEYSPADDDPSRIYKQGYLLKLSSSVRPEWQKRFFRLLPNTLEFWPSETSAKVDGATTAKRFSLFSSAVRKATDPIEARPDRFILRTTSRELICEAATEEAAQEWVTAIDTRIKACLKNGYLDFQDEVTKKIKCLQTEQRLIRAQAVPGNGHCADCQADYPEWFSLPLGILLCINCAGVHRGMERYSKVRSLVFDEWASPLDEAVPSLLQSLGNKKVNAILQRGNELPKDASTLMRTAFIKEKYLKVKQTEADPVLNKRLLVAIQAQDLQATLTLLLSGAGVNCVMPINGMSPLHFAAFEGSLDLALLLIMHGATLDTKDERGRAPSDIALRSGHPKIAKILSHDH